MGEKTASEHGFDVTVIGNPEAAGGTSACDTEHLAGILEKEKADLILFAGGDGTARNVCRAIGDRVPVIGIPAGVKIHSGVYAVNPRSAGQAARQFIMKESCSTKSAEVMDLDEELYRRGIVSPRLYGYMMIPDNRYKMQNVKMRSSSQSDSLDYIASDVIRYMETDTIYLIGAGTTTRNIMTLLGLENTLIGIDAVCDRELIAADLDEMQIWELIQGRKCRLIITAIGGQGHIFGRGNQQLSPRVIRKIGKENISIVATKEKLLSLPDRRLLVDTGDRELDTELEGYAKVITGLDERVMCAVRAE